MTIACHLVLVGLAFFVSLAFAETVTRRNHLRKHRHHPGHHARHHRNNEGGEQSEVEREAKDGHGDGREPRTVLGLLKHRNHHKNAHHHARHHGRKGKRKGIELPEDKMKLTEALMVMPPPVRDLFDKFSKKKASGSVVTSRLKQVYERAQLDRDILEIDCQDRKEGLAFEVKSARQALMAAESDATRVANRMQSLQLKQEQMSNELATIGQQFKMHRTMCDKTKLESKEQLLLLNQDLPLAKKVHDTAKTACGGGTAPALLECGMPDGTVVVTFKAEAERKTISEMSPIAERFVSLSLERAVHGHNAVAAAFLDMRAHSGGPRMFRFRSHHRSEELAHIDLFHAVNRSLSATEHSPVRRLLLQRRLPSSLCTAVAKPPTCDGLMDAMATFVGNVQDSVDELEDRTEQSAAHCSRSLEDYESQMREVSGRIRSANAMLANSAAEGTDADAERRRRQTAYDAVAKEATDQVRTCARQSEEIASSMCGVRRLRKELAVLDKTLPKFHGDCEVTEWIRGPCTSQCGVPGGGRQNLTREVITKPKDSTCPPLRLERVCNDKPCPVDCVMEMWSPWTKCSKSCGGGSKSRQRTIAREPIGGVPCAETTQEVTCSTHACDLDCKLTEWTEWSGCSKACEKGHQVRTRHVLTPSLGEGKCPRKTSLDRRESKHCNVMSCKEALAEKPKCATKLDLVFVVDSSGSVGEDGFKKAQSFVDKTLDRMKLGEEHAKVGVVQFGSTATVEAEFSADVATTKTKANAMTWQKSSTNTAEALAVARDLLTQGRQEAPSVAVVITDGMPTSKYLTATAVTRLHARAIRLVFVTVGTGVNGRVVKQWASWPAKENVLKVHSYKALDEDRTVTKLLANICPFLEK